MNNWNQIGNPQFVNTPQAQMQSPDIMKAMGDQYQGQLSAYNGEVGAQNSQRQAIATVAAAIAMAF